MSRRILGVGNMGAGAIPFGRDHGMDGVFVDIDPRCREAVAEKMCVPVYQTLDEALARHDDIVGAYVATPSHTHAEIAVRLAALNIPVFMEKPLGINQAECDAVRDAYARSKGWLQLDFEYRFSPLYAHAGETLHSGELGELRSIYMEYTVGPYGPDQGWRLDPAKCGGLFAEKLCHLVDLLRFWSRSEPAQVQVTAGPKSIPHYDPRGTDNLVAQFVMDSGVFAHLLHTHGSTAVPIHGRQHEADWTEYGHRLAAYLNTTEGCIRIDIWTRTITVIRRDGEHEMTPRIVRQVSYRHIPFNTAHHDMSGMVKDFVRRVHEHAGPRLPLEDSYKTMCIVCQCDRQLMESSLRANAPFQRRS